MGILKAGSRFAWALTLALAAPVGASTVENRTACMKGLLPLFGASWFETGPVWKSKVLQARPLSENPEPGNRARWITQQLLLPHSPLWVEAGPSLRRLVQSDPQLIEEQLPRAAEFLAYTPAAAHVARTLERWMPASGRIVDYGGGTGHWADSVLRGFAEREYILAESATTLEIARTRLANHPDAARIVYRPTRVGENLPVRSAAVVAVRGLGRFAALTRERLFAEFANALKPRGTLLVVESFKDTQRQWETWYKDQMAAAAERGAPQSEFAFYLLQAARLGYLHPENTGKPVLPHFPTPQALKHEAERHGFELLRRVPTGDGLQELWVLRLNKGGW